MKKKIIENQYKVLTDDKYMGNSFKVLIVSSKWKKFFLKLILLIQSLLIMVFLQETVDFQKKTLNL